MIGKDAGSTGGPSANERRLVLNPTSGKGDHAERVRQLAAAHGFRTVETERAGDAVEFAIQAAADGVELLAACGGDGTVHEVVQGLVTADALGDVTLCIVPAGTANIYAAALGIRSSEEGFAVAEGGEARALDLGFVGDEPFVMSAIAGLPAAASAATSGELKERLGTLAFVVEGIRTAREFDSLEVSIAAVSDDGESYTWEGDALCLLIGNCRRFVAPSEAADAENGTLEVTIVERLPPADALAEVVERRLLKRETAHVTTVEATALEVVGLDDESVRFSLDGEIRDYETAQISVRPRALRVRVPDDPASNAD